jgi:hypothetical protein
MLISASQIRHEHHAKQLSNYAPDLSYRYALRLVERDNLRIRENPGS